MFAILRDFRRLLDALVQAINVLKAVVEDQTEVMRDAGPATDRLEALELSRHQFEAEVQGALLEAKGKLKASLSSEARERHMRKQNERDADPLADDGEERTEEGEGVHILNADPGEEERVSAMRLGLAAGGKTPALMHKWSR